MNLSLKRPGPTAGRNRLAERARLDDELPPDDPRPDDRSRPDDVRRHGIRLWLLAFGVSRLVTLAMALAVALVTEPTVLEVLSR